MKRFMFPVVLALLLAIPTTTAFSADKILTIGVDQEAIGLDPNIVTAFSSHRRVDLLYNKLVRVDDKLSIVPDLALSWENPDNLTYVFKLRKGVKFHNGREMVAADVVYSLNRVLDPKTASPGRSYLATATAIEALDAYTVKIVLSGPLPSLLEGLASNNLAIVPQEVVEKEGNLQKVAVGTGPFMLQEWLPDNSMTLVKNPNYFEKGNPSLDKVIFRVIPEQASLYAGVKSGELDMATISQGAIILQALKDNTITVMRKPSINLRTFGFNNTRKPFDDVRVRQALALALDRTEIIKAAEFNMGQASGPLPVAVKLWAKDPASLPFARPDLAKAKKLLADAGLPNGFTFSIVTASSYEGGLDVAQVIQNQLAKIGVKVELDVVEWGVYIDRWVKRDFDAMVEIRGGSSDPDRFLYRTLHSTGGVNNFLFKDSDVDKLLDQGRSLTKVADRKPVYDKLQVMLTEKAPVIFLYSPMENQIMSKKVTGFKQVGNGSIYYLAETKISN